MSKRRVVVRAAGVLLALAVLGGLGFSWYVGGVLIAPANHTVEPPPAELGASAVTFPSESGSTIHAWYSQGAPGKGAVLLLHGIGADRAAMLPRALEGAAPLPAARRLRAA